MMKALILKPSSFGDVIQSLPVLRLLRRQWPEAQLCWWISSTLAPLLERDPDLDAVIPFDRTGARSLRGLTALIRQIRAIQRQRFDWVIDLQGLARSGVIAWLASGGFTIGVDDPREGAATFYDRAVPRPSAETHAIDWYLQVLVALNVPVDQPFTWLPEYREVRQSLERRWSVAGKDWIAIAPGARWKNKRWPVEYYSALAKRLVRGGGQRHVAVLGGSEDRSLGAAICEQAPERCVDLTGQTSLIEMIEWIRLSKVLVTNDSAPMHVAAALQRPTVALFGPTDPKRTGPYRQTDRVFQARLPCAPCLDKRCHHPIFQHCLRLLSPDAVAQAVNQRLELD